MAVLHRNHRKGMVHQNVQLDVMFLVLAVRNNIECEMKKKSKHKIDEDVNNNGQYVFDHEEKLSNGGASHLPEDV